MEFTGINEFGILTFTLERQIGEVTLGNPHQEYHLASEGGCDLTPRISDFPVMSYPVGTGE